MCDPGGESSSLKISAAAALASASTPSTCGFLSVLGDWPASKRMIKCAVKHAETMVREQEDCERLTVSMDLITDPDFADKDFSDQL